MSLFVTKIVEDGEISYNLTGAGYAVLIVLFILAVASICIIASSGKKVRKIQTKQLVFSSAAIALATVVSVILKLPSFANGGSITLFSMLFICLIGYWYGPQVGITSATAYGILQFITGPYIVHPLQVLFDYPLAFGALGISGFFCKKKQGLVIGYIAGVFGRFVFHMISGLIFYTTYADSLKGNIAAVWGSTVYNLGYILPEAVLTIVLISLPPVSKALKQLKKQAQEA